MIKIENGVVQTRDGWLYAYDTVEGRKTILFTAGEGLVPEIGDFISGGALVKRTGYQVSNDGERKWPADPYQDPSWTDPDYASVGWDKTK